MDFSRNVYVFADPPHLLKLVINNIIDHGLITPEEIVDVGPLKELIISQTDDFRLGFKISENNITLEVWRVKMLKKQPNCCSILL